MSSSIHLKVITPEKILLDAPDVVHLRLPLADGGLIGILPGHAPLIAQTEAGLLFYRDTTGDHKILLRPGILNVEVNEITILTSGQHPFAASLIAQGEISYDRLAESLFTRPGGEGSEDAETI